MAAQPTTMMDALSKVVSDISQAMVTPDADIQFLTQLQGVIVGRMRQGMGGGPSQPQGAGATPSAPPPSPGAGGPGGPGGGQPPGAPMQGQPTPNGVTPLASMPNPDELRRQIAQNVGA